MGTTRSTRAKRTESNPRSASSKRAASATRSKPAAQPEPIESFPCSILAGPITYESDEDRALCRFLDGQSVMLVKADPAHVRVVSEGMWLRVNCVGPDWFAMVAN